MLIKRLHYNFITKLLNSNVNKLSKKIAMFAIRKKEYWYQEWHDLAEEVRLTLNFDESNIDNWGTVLNELLNRIYSRNLDRCHLRALQSSSRETYSKLNYNLEDDSYLCQGYSIEIISTIFKIRGELLNLNYTPHIRNQICTLWKFDEIPLFGTV